MFALGLFWRPWGAAPMVYWPNLIVLVVLLGQQRLAKRQPARYELNSNIQNAMIFLGGVSLWMYLTNWVCGNEGDFYTWLSEKQKGGYLTASWSALALILFTCGIVLRERMYRYLGLGILAVAIGRVFVFDVWRLETLYIILSFMALGLVLLALGFVYNKYQEKIKEWL